MDIRKYGIKKIAVIVSVIIIVIIASLFLASFLQDFLSKDDKRQRPSPEVLYDSVGSQIGSTIDIETETDSRAIPQGTDAIDYSDGEYLTQFVLIGLYNGTVFFDQMVDDKYRVLMQFSYNPDPDDGVIEGCFMPEIIGDEFVVSIYVDEDFRKRFPDANLIWGPYYENVRKFDYSKEVTDGIYVDMITDSHLERFHVGYDGPDANVYVGSASLENAQDGELVDNYGFFLK